jgi:hypothetical protein
MRVWTPKVRNWSSPHAKGQVHLFEETNKLINYMGLNLDTSWNSKRVREKKIKLIQKESCLSGSLSYGGLPLCGYSWDVD